MTKWFSMALALLGSMVAQCLSAQYSNKPDFPYYREMYTNLQLRDLLGYPASKLDARSSSYELSPEVKAVKKDGLAAEFDREGRLVYSFMENMLFEEVYRYSYSYDDKTKETVQTCITINGDADTAQTIHHISKYNESGFMTSGLNTSSGELFTWTYLPDNRILSDPNSVTYEYKPNGDVVLKIVSDNGDNNDDVAKALNYRVCTFNKYGLLVSSNSYENGELTESQNYKYRYKHYFFNRKIKSITQYSDNNPNQKWEFRKDGSFERITEYYENNHYKTTTFDKKNRCLEIDYSLKGYSKITNEYDDEKHIQNVYSDGKLENVLHFDKYGNPIEEDVTYEYFE